MSLCVDWWLTRTRVKESYDWVHHALLRHPGKPLENQEAAMGSGISDEPASEGPSADEALDD
eukprot:6357087-Lingulodinium_polyedra.AAC.1